MSKDFSIAVVRQLTEAGYTAYWAGGCVRDLLRGEDPQDFDVATDATPPQVRELFGKKRTLAVGESFGVIIVLGPAGAGQVEVATFRRDGDYRDGRHPDSVHYTTPQEDALRRDFTINGMFFDPLTETIHDYVGGQQDLQRRIVRAIGDPRARMEEDKLRMLRAVRFAARLDYQLDEATAAVIRDMASQVVVVSAERIAQELRKMLGHPTRATSMRMCQEVGVLDVILPEVGDALQSLPVERWDQLLRCSNQLGPSRFEVALAGLLRDVPIGEEQRGVPLPPTGHVVAICRRLKLSNSETEQIVWLRQHRDAMQFAPQFSAAELKRLAVHPLFPELVTLERTFAAVEGKSSEPFEWIDRFLREIPANELNPPELLDGRDLISLGHRPGPRFKEWLIAIRDAQLNGEIQTRDEALKLIARLAR